MTDIPTGTTYGVNNEGTIIVGTVGTVGTVDKERSIYWMNGSPPTIRNIGFLKDGTHASVFAVSGDGVISVGHGDTAGGVEHAFS